MFKRSLRKMINSMRVSYDTIENQYFNHMNNFLKISVFLLMVYALSSCSKEAGEGGKASIFGKVYVKDYNSTFTVLNGSYYGGNVVVYIIYGDDKSYGDRIRTSYDGTYEFQNLRPGKYQVFAYSKDSAGVSASGTVPVIKNIEITKRKQDVQVDDIVIFD